MLRFRGLLFIVALISIFVTMQFHCAIAQNSKPQPVQDKPSNDVVFQRFLEWLPSARPANEISEVVNEYRAHLKAAGPPDAEVNRLMGIISRAMHERPDGWRVAFNNVYASTTPGYVTQPNALLVATVEGHKPGRALDIGMGQGRNAVFLALKGWDVTGFDISDQGIALARKNAKRAGVKITAVCESDEAFDYGSDKWDLIVDTYNPFPVTSTAYVERLRKSMKSGGLFVLETFAAGSKGSWTATDPSQLLVAFKDFRLLHFEDTFAKPDFVSPQEKLHIVRMVVEKRQ
jgi:SAM-dependent methyltransferase